LGPQGFGLEGFGTAMGRVPGGGGGLVNGGLEREGLGKLRAWEIRGL
jgi:hypothetical protein